VTLQRYAAGSPRRRFNKEFRFRLVQDLKGKQVLDLGCGDGTNSVLLAQRGASVIGVDLSQKSIALANERARINRVEGQKFLGFLDRFLLVQNNYESALAHRRSMSNFLHWIDYVLLSTPGHSIACPGLDDRRVRSRRAGRAGVGRVGLS
jgi:SAM-dependent methyltransferase